MFNLISYFLLTRCKCSIRLARHRHPSVGAITTGSVRNGNATIWMSHTLSRPRQSFFVPMPLIHSMSPALFACVSPWCICVSLHRTLSICVFRMRWLKSENSLFFYSCAYVNLSQMGICDFLWNIVFHSHRSVFTTILLECCSASLHGWVFSARWVYDATRFRAPNAIGCGQSTVVWLGFLSANRNTIFHVSAPMLLYVFYLESKPSLLPGSGKVYKSSCEQEL